MRSISPPKNLFLRGIYLMTRRYLRHNVGIQSAALAFYLLFTLFPVLIFISALLGLLNLDVAAIIQALRTILPADVLNLVEMYLTYVSSNHSPQLLLFGLFFSIYFPMRATNALMRSVRTAYHLGPPRGVILPRVKALLYTVLLIITIALTLTLMTVGDRVLIYAVEHFHLPAVAATVSSVCSGGIFRTVLPLRFGAGRPPALAEYLARYAGSSGRLAVYQLGLCHVCQ